MSKFNQLASDLLKLDDVDFEQLGETVRDILRRHGFIETANITFADGGMPVGTTNRKAYYSPQMEAAAVVELAQDWADYYNDENDAIEWKEYFNYRVYIYDSVDCEPFDDDSLYFAGDYAKYIVFCYYRNNLNDLYTE